ncbi:unnamed protein product [Adineta steineri]|uniref:Uncharacterized protein n=1 Tax=Adineta steineri TaxID=433720 RepID=A0A815MHQ3_9BILA|nr:unnamed protein product [Adineta steineri]CAF1465540.1 unnamed protein product [Adineta steineri]CAF3677940.1 unnamed protein product [Adineta steineri]CAF3995909.1 unnamed protein product [Adineta steineri]
MMTNNEPITMVVHWKEQRRLMTINRDDDMSTIEKAIVDIYQLQKVYNLSEYQIQYYDIIHQTFIDLYPGTFLLFQQLLLKLSSEAPPPRKTKAWILKIVPKTVETMCHTFQDDTYNYQQANDPTEFLPTEKPSSTMHNSTIPLFFSCGSRTDNPNNLSRVTSQIDDDNEEFKLDTIDSKIKVTTKHPYGLGFDGDLAQQQRVQFESDMLRKSSSKTTIAGVLLRAAQKSHTTSNEDISYPTVHFKISTDKIHLGWSLYVYVLTEADSNGIHYIHASKGIFDNCTKAIEKFGIIPNTEIVNPYTISLAQNDLRDEKYEIHVKVCNITNLSNRKHTQLREFPPLNNTMIYDDKTLLSNKTTHDMKFSSDKYHLGCILVCQGKAYDRCISSLTIAGRKRNCTETIRGEEDDDDESSLNKIQRK